MHNNVYVKTLQKGKDGASWHSGTATGTYDPSTHSYPSAVDGTGAAIIAVKGDMLFDTVRNQFFLWGGSKWVYQSTAESGYIHIYKDTTDGEGTVTATTEYRGRIRVIDGKPYYEYEEIAAVQPAANTENNEENNEESQEGE